jgi:hypothetical protein
MFLEKHKALFLFRGIIFQQTGSIYLNVKKYGKAVKKP